LHNESERAGDFFGDIRYQLAGIAFSVKLLKVVREIEKNIEKI
jgi:hypothetical protein